MNLALIKALRPKQWAKNVLIFAAVVFDRKLTNVPALLSTLAGFFLFSLLASTVYLINDLMDVKADRQHPKKRHRPIASGALPEKAAFSFSFKIRTGPSARGGGTIWRWAVPAPSPPPI